MVDPGLVPDSSSLPTPLPPGSLTSSDTVTELFAALRTLNGQFAEQRQQVQVQQAALESLAAAVRSPHPASGSLQQQSAASASSSLPTFTDLDNLAGDLSNRRDNPIQRPPYLSGDDALPAFFDINIHAGARKVKAVLGTHAGFEIETLGCSLSFLYDSAAAAAEIADAIKRLAPSGPNNTISPEHAGLFTRVSRLTENLEGVYKLLKQRFSLLVASAQSPNNKTLLNALTAKVRATTLEDLIPDEDVRVAIKELESKRAEELFKAAAKFEAAKSSSGAHLGSDNSKAGNFKPRGNRLDFRHRNRGPAARQPGRGGGRPPAGDAAIGEDGNNQQ